MTWHIFLLAVAKMFNDIGKKMNLILYIFVKRGWLYVIFLFNFISLISCEQLFK